METLISHRNTNNYTSQGWGAALLLGTLKNAIKFGYTAEIERVECLPDFMLVEAGMKISEKAFEKVWEAEEGWDIYLKD